MLNKTDVLKLIKRSDKVQQFTDFRVLVDKMKNGDLDTEGLVPIGMQSTGTPVEVWTTQLSAFKLSSPNLCLLVYLDTYQYDRLGLSCTD